jgi:hypothetical protein
MALSIGNKTCTSGLSQRIYDQLCSEWNTEMGYDLTAQSAEAQEMWQLVCYSFAKGVVDEITANAVVSGTSIIAAGQGGLQRDADGANPDCLGPTVQKYLTVNGTVS